MRGISNRIEWPVAGVGTWFLVLGLWSGTAMASSITVTTTPWSSWSLLRLANACPIFIRNSSTFRSVSSV